MCSIYENDQQLYLYTMLIMASHQVIVAWHKMVVSEGVSQGYVIGWGFSLAFELRHMSVRNVPTWESIHSLI